MKYHFKVHKEGEGFWAECLELPGCVTQGDTIEELKYNMCEALNLFIEEPEDSKQLMPFPDDSIRLTRNIVEVPLDPQIAFAFMVRYCRLKQGLTQKEVAKRMGFDKLYSYQRLEARKCNPSLKIIFKLKRVFPDFSIDYAVNV
jgi:predicted RNase H-like HicB family nuclease/DNA-binding XRE family transcriptional regulator